MFIKHSEAEIIGVVSADGLDDKQTREDIDRVAKEVQKQTKKANEEKVSN